MRKNEVAAYLIMEAVSEQVQPENVQFFDKNNLFYVRFNTTLQSFGVENRNKRTYAGDAMMQSLQAEHILELQANKSWFGEAGHPMSDDIKRILTIDPKLISHKIVSHTANNRTCKACIETLDDDNYGRQMTRHILQGMRPAFSLRALAPLVKNNDGSTLVKSRAHVVTYDWVILPSHKDAYADNAPVEKMVKRLSLDGNTVAECALTQVNESMITSFIQMESANVKMVSNVCEVAMENMTLSSDLKHVILRENGGTYITPIEDKICHDINRFMRNL